mgnify:CR=1 FL=1
MLIFCASTQNIDPYSLTIDVIAKVLTHLYLQMENLGKAGFI